MSVSLVFCSLQGFQARLQFAGVTLAAPFGSSRCLQAAPAMSWKWSSWFEDWQWCDDPWQKGHQSTAWSWQSSDQELLGQRRTEAGAFPGPMRTAERRRSGMRAGLLAQTRAGKRLEESQHHGQKRKNNKGRPWGSGTVSHARRLAFQDKGRERERLEERKRKAEEEEEEEKKKQKLDKRGRVSQSS